MIREDHRARVQGFIDNGLADGGEIVLAKETRSRTRGTSSTPSCSRPAARQPAGAERGVRPGRCRRPLLHRGGGDRLANDTPYGLAANIYTPDVQHGRELAASLRSGTVWVNGGGNMRPDAPFGGFGLSGVGREIGEWGIREYLEPQHVQWRP